MTVEFDYAVFICLFNIKAIKKEQDGEGGGGPGVIFKNVGGGG